MSEARSGLSRTRRSVLALVIVFLALAAILAIAWPERRLLLVRAVALLEEPPPLSEPVDEPAPVRWFDDYFTIEPIDPDTIAIGEPRYAQQNYNYLILGMTRAILFDSGPGIRDLRPVVESLTDLPVTVVASHLHYDHVGNHARFDRIALVDLPHLRERARGDVFRPSPAEHLGFVEDFEPPRLEVSEWWTPGSRIDLGHRSLVVRHAPGHTPESIVLHDEERRLLFTGDYLYEGPLFAFVPGSDLKDYARTTEDLLEVVPPGTRLLGAHRETPPGAPILERADLSDLARTLAGLREGSVRGEGFYLETAPVNERIRLLFDESW